MPAPAPDDPTLWPWLASGVGLAAAFLAGSVPSAWLLVRAARGLDVREFGSGNVGATNASRVFDGRRARFAAFLTIYVADFVKGLAPVLFVPPLVAALAPGSELASAPWLAVLAGLAAVLGHCFTPWLGGRGGKGVATSTGVFAGLEPAALLAALIVFFVVRSLSGHVFWGSLALGVALAVGVIVRDPATAFTSRAAVSAAALATALFLIWTHRSNLRAFFSRSAQAPTP